MIIDTTNKQKTLKKEITFSGKGLFTGKNVTMRLIPASQNQKIVFCRTDLLNKPQIVARLSSVQHTHLSTILGNQDIRIQTVEHLLSALHAYQIDNLIIEIDGPEVPIGDGSSLPFVQLIEEAGICDLEATKKVFCPQKPIFFSDHPTHLVVLPAEHFSVSYTLHYPHCSYLGSQLFSAAIAPDLYKQQIAPARTFAIYEEIAPLLDTLIQGGGLENSVIIKDNIVLNPEGVRFEDEMARHKVLDLLGDLSLLGYPIQGHVIAVRSGHASNIAFARKIEKVLLEGNEEVIKSQTNCADFTSSLSFSSR